MVLATKYQAQMELRLADDFLDLKPWKILRRPF